MSDKNPCCGGVRLVFPCSDATDVGGIARELGLAKGKSPANEANINAAFEKVKSVME